MNVANIILIDIALLLISVVMIGIAATLKKLNDK
jgi:hypothetical protein